MLKRIVFVMLMLISTLNLYSAGFSLPHSYHFFKIRYGTGVSSLFKDNSFKAFDILWSSNIHLKKSYNLQVEPTLEYLFGTQKETKYDELMINFKVPVLLNYRLNRHCFLLGPSVGVTTTKNNDSEVSFSLVLSGGYEVFVSKSMNFDIRFNLGIFSSIDEYRYSSILLGIGFKIF